MQNQSVSHTGEIPPDIQFKLSGARQAHDDLHTAVECMKKAGSDPFAIERMKKRKLLIKDEVTRLEAHAQQLSKPARPAPHLRLVS